MKNTKDYAKYAQLVADKEAYESTKKELQTARVELTTRSQKIENTKSQKNCQDTIDLLNMSIEALGIEAPYSPNRIMTYIAGKFQRKIDEANSQIESYQERLTTRYIYTLDSTLKNMTAALHTLDLYEKMMHEVHVDNWKLTLSNLKELQTEIEKEQMRPINPSSNPFDGAVEMSKKDVTYQAYQYDLRQSVIELEVTAEAFETYEALEKLNSQK